MVNTLSEAFELSAAVGTLPPSVFRSHAFFRLEDLAVWTQDWICVGTHYDIPAIGDLLPFTVGIHGLHVQRVDTGLVARFNKAQHGGCRLVPIQCQTGTKTRCSFTSCGYSRDRRPIAGGELGDDTPAMHQYLGLRPERLLSVALRKWGPLLFVRLSDGGDDFDTSVSSLEALHTILETECTIHLATRWMEYAANWKLLAQSLVGDALTDPHDHANCFVARSTMSNGDPLDVAWLFPNLVLLSDGTSVCAIVLQPTAIGQTLCRMSVFGPRHENSQTAERRWRDRLSCIAVRAEAEHTTVLQWDTMSRPDTMGTHFPLRHNAPSQWMRRVLSRKITAVPANDADLQRYQMSRHQ